jgi:glycerol-1-phosphate dehydrogenase [NAD(P)+]
MNGYASANVASQVEGVKLVVRAHCPIAVYAKPDIIENSPKEMTAAGFADTLAKFQSTADWYINNLLFDEYYCPYCADILEDLQDKYLLQPENIQQGGTEAIKALFEALFLTGAAMTMIGTSIPASGGEHLFSHTLDMTANVNDQGHCLHGLQVGLGTIISAALYQKIIETDKPQIHELPAEISASYWKQDSLIQAVKKQYRAKQEYIPDVKEKIADAEIFGEIKARAIEKTKTPEQIKDWLKRSGAPHSYQGLGCSPQRLKEAMLHMHEMRSRFTVVDLAWLLGILPNATDEIIEKHLS